MDTSKCCYEAETIQLRHITDFCVSQNLKKKKKTVLTIGIIFNQPVPHIQSYVWVHSQNVFPLSTQYEST